MAKNSSESKKEIPIEVALWNSAVKLRGNVEFSQYKHVVLNLIFLKFISDRFENRYQELINEGKSKFLEIREFYTMKNVFYLPEESRWQYLIANAKQNDIALKIDVALNKIENENPSLVGALPNNYYSGLGLEPTKLASLLDEIGRIDTTKDKDLDLFGRVYEYFLSRFSAKEGLGEYYTPKCIVNLIAEMIEPYKGKILDPCCGSGGMFVQSVKFVEAHGGNQKNISIYGQESISTTLKLAKMNLAIRGISANFGDSNADSFRNDKHKDLKADFIMANPPFNKSDWGRERLLDDPRWKYGVPPENNANYAWIQHFISHLSTKGVAGFVLANGSLTTKQKDEINIRKNMIEDRQVDCIVSMPNNLFYSVTLPVCLWFVSEMKKERTNKSRDSILFIDCRKMGHMIDRTHRTLTDDEISLVSNTYHEWKNGTSDYSDVPGFCKSVTIDDVKKENCALTPGRYVGLAEQEEDGAPYEEKMERLTSELSELFKESDRLKEEVRKNLATLGYKL